MKYLMIALTLLITSCQPAMAAPVDVWTGAGPNACHGKCSFSGSEHMLSDERMAQLRDVQADQPEPQLIYVNDGAVIDIATYFKDGKQVAYNTVTVVSVSTPEPALGWDMGDWQWVMLDDCSNPSAVTNQTMDTTGIPKGEPRDANVSSTTRQAASSPSGSSFSLPEPSITVGGLFTSSTFTEGEFEIPPVILIGDDPDPITPPTTPTITAVPLSGTWAYLLIGYIVGFCSMGFIRWTAGH